MRASAAVFITALILSVCVICCSTKKTCSAGDVDCYLDNIYFLTGDGGTIDSVSISTSAIPAAADGGTDGGAPTITNQPGSMNIKPGYGTFIELDWTDPQGAQPAFCHTLCNPRFRCSARSRCTPSIRDHRISGVWRSYIGFNTEPADSSTTEHFQDQVTPISASGDQDPVAMMQANPNGTSGGGPLLAGPPVIVQQTLTGGGDNGGGSGGGCGTDCSGFGARHCSGARNAVYGSDNLCHCCQVLCPGGTNCRCITCSEVSCGGGSGAPDMCVNGNCVFKVGGTACD